MLPLGIIIVIYTEGKKAGQSTRPGLSMQEKNVGSLTDISNWLK